MTVYDRLRRRATNLHQQRWTAWLLAILVFFFASWFYMGSAITSCSTYTPAMNSDTSGGIAWFQWASGNAADWDYTTKSNFPVGESLERPQFVTSEAFLTPYRLLSTVTTPICGINLMILAGYLSTALAMFGLVYWLFKRQDIAYLAAFAAAFSPFHQLKTQSHVVYATAAIFILIIWAFFAYVKSPTVKRALLLAALSALGVYTDGYFVLFTITLLAALFLSLLLKGVVALAVGKQKNPKLSIRWSNIGQNVKDNWKQMIVFGLSLAVLLSPIAYVQMRYGSEIKQSLAASRSNIQGEVRTYGSRLEEFVLPNLSNPLLPDRYAAWRVANMHDSNPSETTLSLGISIIALAVVGIFSCLSTLTRRRKLTDKITYGFVVGTSLVGALLAFSLSMPARIRLLWMVVPTPVAVLIHFTANWRVLARFFLVIHPLVIIIAAAGLYFLSKRLSKWKFRMLYILSGIVLFLEFLTFPILGARPGADLYKDSPSVYRQLQQDQTVDTIAEYPLLDLSYVPTVFTFQQLHGKNVINANESSLTRNNFKLSIASVNDAQTLGILKYLGVDVVTSYGMEVSSPHLQPYTKSPNAKSRMGLPDIYAYHIGDVPLLKYALIREKGFDFPWFDKTNISHHYIAKQGTLIVAAVKPSDSVRNQVRASFRLASVFDVPTEVKITQGNRLLWQGSASQEDQPISLQVSGRVPITITTNQPVDITQLLAQ